MTSGVVGEWVAAVALLITFSTLLGNVLYRSGHLAARVEELEKWRGNLRNDMHEISEKLETMSTQLSSLMTLIEERTERRQVTRPVEEDHRRSS